MELSLLLSILIVPVIVLKYLARVLCGRESRSFAQVDQAGNLDYRESSGWIPWRIGLFLVVLPALIVLDRLLG
jgi:hypothetical protein